MDFDADDSDKLPELPPMGHPLQKLGARLAELLDDDHWAECERLMLEVWAHDEIDRKTGAHWREDSSLAVWFPLTADELERLRVENAALRFGERHNTNYAALPENDMEQGYYGKIETPREAIYEAACALDNQDVPLEDWPVKLIAALARAGFAVVPVELPHDALGRAAIAGVAETGNPKHAWDFLIAATRAA